MISIVVDKSAVSIPMRNQQPLTTISPEQRGSLLSTLFALQVPCKSDMNGIFTNTKRLEVIRDLLWNSPYQESRFDRFAMYTKQDFAKTLEGNPDSPVVLITSHADLVPAITNPNCSFSAFHHSIRGTLDNTITNAACVCLMKENDLPANVVFAFTADEETGRCRGARDVIQYLMTAHKITKDRIHPIALDVTYDGYEQNKSFTIENCRILPKEKNPLLGYLLQEISTEEYMYVPKKKEDRIYMEQLQLSEIVSPEYSWYDEAAFYEQNGFSTASICLPVAEGNMHSNRGVKTSLDIMDRYTQSLHRIAKEYTNALVSQKNYEEIFQDLKPVSLMDYQEEPEEDYEQISLTGL